MTSSPLAKLLDPGGALAIVGEPPLTCSVETPLAGPAGGIFATYMIVVGSDATDAGVQPHRFLLGLYAVVLVLRQRRVADALEA